MPDELLRDSGAVVDAPSLEQRASRRTIPEKLLGLDDQALSIALVEINNAAKRQRDMASAHCQANMHGLAKAAKETKEFLYSLKDDVLRRLVNQERARIAGYHSKPDPRGAVNFVRRWVPDPYTDDDDGYDPYDRPKEWVAIPNPNVTVDAEGYAITYMEAILDFRWPSDDITQRPKGAAAQSVQV